MGIKKGVSIFIFMILLILPFAFSQPKTDYPAVGGESDYSQGEGIFGSNINFISRGVGTSGDTQIPLVADLDGDGTNEIIIVDGSTVRLLNSSLGTKDTLSTSISGLKSNVITFDVDGDGRREIMFAGDEQELIIVMDWNGTDLTLQSSLNYSSS